MSSLKPRPTQDEMAALITDQHQRQQNAPSARGHKPPDNMQEIRQQTPIFLGEVRQRNVKNFGQKTSFYNNPELLNFEIGEYFQLCLDNNAPPSVSMLAVWLGVTRDTLHEWEHDAAYGISDIIKNAKEYIVTIKLHLAETKQTSEIIAIFGLKTMHGFVEQQHINITAQSAVPRTDVDTDDFNRQALQAAKLIGDGS